MKLDTEDISDKQLHEYVEQWMMRLTTGGNNMVNKVEDRRVIVVGTRQSALALTQTGQVIDQLKAICALHKLQYDFEIRKIVTKGDRILDVTLSKVGGKGLFVKEIEQALFDKEIDLAVHSMKDMPYELPEGLINGAVPKRVDPRDCLISKDGLRLISSRKAQKSERAACVDPASSRTLDQIFRLNRYGAISTRESASWRRKALMLSYLLRPDCTVWAGKRKYHPMCP